MAGGLTTCGVTVFDLFRTGNDPTSTDACATPIGFPLLLMVAVLKRVPLPVALTYWRMEMN